MRLSQKEHKEWKDKLNKIGLIPKYSEVYLFLVAVTFLLLFVLNKQFRYFLLEWIILFLLIFIGIPFSIYYAFSSKKPTKYARDCMTTFVVILNCFIALDLVFYIMSISKNFLLYLFPILNLINAYLLMTLNLDSDDLYLNKNAKRHEIVIGFIFLLIVFIISNYILKNYWAITFSICLVYSSMLNKLVTKLFFKDKN